MNRYDQVRADWEKLWAIDTASDMTGGYVDQQDLALMLETPTKKMAVECMTSQIIYWFQEGPQHTGDSQPFIEFDPEVRDIAERYDCLTPS